MSLQRHGGVWGGGHEIQPDGLNILEELLCYKELTGIDQRLHLTDLLVSFFHEGDHKVHKLCLYICSVWKLVNRNLMSYTSTGFLQRIKKFSARIRMEHMNLWHSIFSVSQQCWPWQSWWRITSESFPSQSCFATSDFHFWPVVLSHYLGGEIL